MTPSSVASSRSSFELTHTMDLLSALKTDVSATLKSFLRYKRPGESYRASSRLKTLKSMARDVLHGASPDSSQQRRVSPAFVFRSFSLRKHAKAVLTRIGVQHHLEDVVLLATNTHMIVFAFDYAD